MTTAAAAQRTARVAGFAYLVIFVLAILANFLVLEPMGVKGDPSATAANIAGGEPLYRLAVAAFLVVLIADIVVGWGLFVVLKAADASFSLLVLLFRAAYTIAHIGVVLQLMGALAFATQPPLTAPFAAGAPAMSYHLFASHGLGFTMTLIFFGVHLLLLGVLIQRSGYMPRFVGWLVCLAGLVYAADGFGTVVLGSYGDYAGVATLAVIVPALVGEGVLMFWLLIRGVDVARYPVQPA